MRSPRKRTSPSTGRSKPDNARISVVLPAPFAPRTATSSPAAIARSRLPHYGCGAIAGRQRADCHQRLLRNRERLFAAALRLLAGAEVGFQHRRIGGHLSGRSFGDLGAGVEHDHMAGDAHHQIHVVLDQDHGHAHGRELAQQRTDRRGILRVQPCRRLIEREYARPDRERAGDFDQPFVDMRERIRRPIERTFVADKGEQAFSDLGIVAALAAGAKIRRKPAAPQRDHDIVDHRHRFEQLACLIGTRNAGARNLIGAQTPKRCDRRASPFPHPAGRSRRSH